MKTNKRTRNYAEDVLNNVIRELWDRVKSDSKNPYWLVVGEKKGKKVKPKVVNINRASWEFALNNSPKKEVYDLVMNMFDGKKWYYQIEIENQYGISKISETKAGTTRP